MSQGMSTVAQGKKRAASSPPTDADADKRILSTFPAMAVLETIAGYDEDIHKSIRQTGTYHKLLAQPFMGKYEHKGIAICVKRIATYNIISNWADFCRSLSGVRRESTTKSKFLDIHNLLMCANNVSSEAELPPLIWIPYDSTKSVNEQAVGAVIRLMASGKGLPERSGRKAIAPKVPRETELGWTWKLLAKALDTPGHPLIGSRNEKWRNFVTHTNTAYLDRDKRQQTAKGRQQFTLFDNLVAALERTAAGGTASRSPSRSPARVVNAAASLIASPAHPVSHRSPIASTAEPGVAAGGRDRTRSPRHLSPARQPDALERTAVRSTPSRSPSRSPARVVNAAASSSAGPVDTMGQIPSVASAAELAAAARERSRTRFPRRLSQSGISMSIAVLGRRSSSASSVGSNRAEAILRGL